MVAETGKVPAADLLIRRLSEHGVRHVFGYPGGQLTPIYDALSRTPAIRHFLARHEQAAGFMADGYARATGRPGVCLAVCGPGVLNSATPLLTAFTDSIPLLLISGQVPSTGLGLRSGYYHENDQARACAPLTKRCFSVRRVEDLLPAFDEAWLTLTTGRPGPVLFEVPIDLLRTEVTRASLHRQVEEHSRTPPPDGGGSPGDIEALARMLQGWRRPLLLAGGGVVSAGAETLLARLAERLGAPVLQTAMGKCSLPASHPLAVGLPWFQATSDLTGMDDFFWPLLSQADGLLAIGCRFSQLTTGSWTMPRPACLAHIDIDPEEIGRHYPVQLGIHADAQVALKQLLALLPESRREAWTTAPVRRDTWRLPGVELLSALRRTLPADAILSVDITRLGYILMTDFPLDHPRTFLHPAGAVSMGYGIPAALAAKAAFPDRVVVAVAGDGGFMMSGLELATAVQERLPIIVVLINDNSLTLIRSTQKRRYAERYIAVDLHNPDFGQFAAAFGVRYSRADSDEAFEQALKDALQQEMTTVIEVRPGDAQAG